MIVNVTEILVLMKFIDISQFKIPESDYRILILELGYNTYVAMTPQF